MGNQEDDDKIKINLVGMGIGDGWMSPYHNARYANQLYQVGLMDEQDHDYCLAQEQNTQHYIDAGNLYEAWQSWNNEFGYFLTKMDCGYYYNIAICDFDPAEDNYEDFCNLASTRGPPCWSDAVPQPWRRVLLHDQRVHGVADARHRVRPQRRLQDPHLRRQLRHHLQPFRHPRHDCGHAVGRKGRL